ncbi:MAG: GNAT family N-acetyltransferase, partial [Clostridia bacterium]
MRKIQLQPLTAQDIPVLHALLNEPTIMDALHMRPTTATLWQDAFAAWENDADEENYLITSDHQPVGWMRLNGLSDKPDAWLSMLAVGTAYQRQGIGRQAVLLAETILQGRGYRQLRIHTSEENLAAQHCYRSLRYAQTERLDCTSADGASRMEYTYRKTLAPDMESIRRHWYAYAYDQLENQTDDVTCMLKLLGNAPKQLLEVCCGGGRFLVPLAKTGHTVTG